MNVRGVRGAIQVPANTRRAIHASTRELVAQMVDVNGIDPDAIAAALFTVTDDLNADFPAYAARDLGWKAVPMMCHREIPVPRSMKRVLRVLLLVNTPRAARDIRHVYIGEAACLRPDLAAGSARPSRRRRR